MDYEKKYKEALERAREYWETDNDNTLDIKAKGTMEYLFPELAESEDERIRKELISLVENWKIFNPNSPFDEHPVYTSDKDTVDKILAWLEKQGETYTKKDVDNAYLEGMAFAKDELEKQGKQKSQRMISAEAKEAMYDKPADKVEPKCEESKTKIFDAPTPFEDKLYVFVAACEFLAIPSKIEFILEHSQEILDAAREQIGKEQSSAWSEEDERTIHNIDAAIRHEVVFPINELKSMEIWLESLKYRVCPKHEWKRDEKMFQLIKDVIDVYRKTQGSVIGGIHTEELKDFLNCIASKQDWKPSNEQIEILDMVLTNESMDDNIARILRELREQLKKLREE